MGITPKLGAPTSPAKTRTRRRGEAAGAEAPAPAARPAPAADREPVATSDEDETDDGESIGEREHLLQNAEDVTKLFKRGIPPNWEKLRYEKPMYHDRANCRFVITRDLTLPGGGHKIVVAYETPRYYGDVDYHAKRVDVINAIFGWRSNLEAYARRVADGHIPGDITKILDGMTEPEQYCEAIDAARARAEQYGIKDMLSSVCRRLQKIGLEAKDKAGNPIKYLQLAKIILSPVAEATWLGNPNYDGLMNEARAEFADRLSRNSRHNNFLYHINKKFKKRSVLFRDMLDGAYGARLHPDTLDALLPYFQTDHLNSRLCDDPINFYLLFSTANGKFGFENLMNYKKEITGPAWAGVVYYVNCAVELQGRLYRA